MQHDAVTVLLSRYADRELSAPLTHAIEVHLKTCPDCVQRFGEYRQLTTAIAELMPPLRAPDALRSRVIAALDAANAMDALVHPNVRIPKRLARRSRVWPFAVAAALVLSVGVAWVIGSRRAAVPDPVVDAILDNHVRALMAGTSHLTDVASGDQHTVKPWFDGKLDFSPVVVELSAEGFPLVGGRLERIAHRSVAALVYGRRRHTIDLYAWPSRDDAGPGTLVQVRNGFTLVRWTRSGITYWAVSDLSPSELGVFVRLVQQAGASAD